MFGELSCEQLCAYFGVENDCCAHAAIAQRHMHLVTSQLGHPDLGVVLLVVPDSGEWSGHGAAWAARDTPLSFASRSISAIRQRGILPAVFQLETVEGGAWMAFATSTVPPKAAIICSAVIMRHELR
nr:MULTISPECIES: hypothetical protein [unclassified Novosphingobium]